MADDHRNVADDIAWVDEQLADPDASFDALRADFPFLGSAAHARQFLQEIREGLVAARDGRVVPHEQIVREAEERRRRYGPHAAE
jgi:hypothetical protein